jgi:FMN phosphatase YigB (HAD superfamily)
VDPLRVLLLAQLAGSYKRGAEAYLTALRLLDCPPAEAGMVAAHPSDLRAAAAVGLRPIFVRRPLEWDLAGIPRTRPRSTACSTLRGATSSPRPWAADPGSGSPDPPVMLAGAR